MDRWWLRGAIRSKNITKKVTKNQWLYFAVLSRVWLDQIAPPVRATNKIPRREISLILHPIHAWMYACAAAAAASALSRKSPSPWPFERGGGNHPLSLAILNNNGHLSGGLHVWHPQHCSQRVAKTLLYRRGCPPTQALIKLVASRRTGRFSITMSNEHWEVYSEWGPSVGIG